MSYSSNTFSIARSGEFYLLTFSVTSTALTIGLPSLVYVNTNTVSFTLNRFNSNLVMMRDGQGAVTVDYTKCSNITSVSASNFVNQVLAL
jgi:hypothetical protein